MRRLVIDGAAVAENLRAIRAAAGDAVFYGVLKADGYGAGLLPMAALLAAQGVDRVAVTEPAEAAALLESAVPVREILLLRPVDPAETEPLLRSGRVVFSIGSAEDAVALARAGLRLGVRPRAHIQVDTGLGRYGFRWDEPGRLCFLYKSFTAVRFEGIYTHFAGGGRGRTRQFDRFCELLRALAAAGIDPGLRHCCASSALFCCPAMALDAVRVGSALLGRAPNGERFGLVDACRCEATLEAVRVLRPGDTVGYGSRFRARREMRVAIADIGSIHGLGASAEGGRHSGPMRLREWLRQGLRLCGGSYLYAVAGGRRVPVLGNICSECCVLDVTDTDAQAGDTAVFPLNPMFARGMERVWENGAQDANMRPVA